MGAPLFIKRMHLTEGLPLRFSGTAAIAPIIAAVKDGKSVIYEGKEVRSLFSLIILRLQVGPGTLDRALSGSSTTLGQLVIPLLGSLIELLSWLVLHINAAMFGHSCRLSVQDLVVFLMQGQMLFLVLELRAVSKNRFHMDGLWVHDSEECHCAIYQDEVFFGVWGCSSHCRFEMAPPSNCLSINIEQGRCSGNSTSWSCVLCA